MTGRSFTKKMLGTSAAILAAIALFKPSVENTNNYLPTSTNTIQQLAGHSVNSFTTRAISGLEGIVKDSTYNTDYQKQLAKLWNIKELNNPGLAPQVTKLGEHLQSSYNQQTATKLSLEAYIQEAQRTIDNTEINWNRVQQTKLPNAPEKLSTLQDLSKRLTATDLLAYSMTELFGSTNGQKNQAVYDHVLQTAGRDFIERVPAFDRWESYGPYQFTPPALQEINRVQQTSFDIQTLKENQHHEAAYRLAVTNLADFLRVASNQEIDVLISQSDEELTKFVAAMHYKPRDAIRTKKGDLHTPFEQALRNRGFTRIANYVQKTGSNRRALRDEPPLLTPQNNAFVRVGTNSEGLDVYRYQVTPGDNPYRIVNAFQEQSGKVANPHVHARDGSILNTIHPNNDVYLLAQEAPN